MKSTRKETHAERVLEQLGTPRTQKELSALTRIQPCDISTACATLKARSLIHITGYEAARGARIYLVGNKPDAIKPDAGARLVLDWAVKVLHALKHGDMTHAQLMEVTEMASHSTHLALRHLHADHQIHICEFVGNTNSQHIYRHGDGVDAKPRKATRRDAERNKSFKIPPPDPLTAFLLGR